MLKRKIWRFFCITIVLTLVVTYSPLVLRANKIDPWVLGLPFTLWSTLVSAFFIVLLTAIAAYFRPEE